MRDVEVKFNEAYGTVEVQYEEPLSHMQSIAEDSNEHIYEQPAL